MATEKHRQKVRLFRTVVQVVEVEVEVEVVAGTTTMRRRDLAGKAARRGEYLGKVARWKDIGLQGGIQVDDRILPAGEPGFTVRPVEATLPRAEARRDEEGG